MAMVPMMVGERVCFTLVQTVPDLQWFGLYFCDVIMVYESNRHSIEVIVWTLNCEIFLEIFSTITDSCDHEPASQAGKQPCN